MGAFAIGSPFDLTTNIIEEERVQAGVEIAQALIEVKWVPNTEEVEKCFEFGKKFGEAVKGPSLPQTQTAPRS